eukprot:980779-Rhodomonas_salina.2
MTHAHVLNAAPRTLRTHPAHARAVIGCAGPPQSPAATVMPFWVTHSRPRARSYPRASHHVTTTRTRTLNNTNAVCDQVGVRAVECVECGAASASLEALSAHLRRNHSKSFCHLSAPPARTEKKEKERKKKEQRKKNRKKKNRESSAFLLCARVVAVR